MVCLLAAIFVVALSAEAERRIIHVPEANGLSSLLPYGERENVTELIISGYLDGADFSIIREMASSNGNLSTLDMENVSIVNNLNPYIRYPYTTYHYPDGIGEAMFRECTKLITIKLPREALYIYENAFQGCSNLVYVELPSMLQRIDKAAFNGCTNLTTVDLPDAATTLGESVFSGCSSLKQVTIGAGMHTIGNYAFAACGNLKEVILLSDTVSLAGNAVFTPSLEPTIYSMTADRYKAAPYWSNLSSHLVNLVDHDSILLMTERIGPKRLVHFDTNHFVYSGVVPDVTYTNALQQYELSVDLREMSKEAGIHNTNVVFRLSDGTQELAMSVPYHYTIDKAPLTIAVKDTSRIFGDENPTFECFFSGFVGQDAVTSLTALPVFSTEATPTTTVGIHDVTASGAQSPNYTFTYETGQLTVTKAPLKVYLPDTTFCYGESYPSMMLLQYEGLKNNEQQPALKAGNKIYLNWKAGQKPGTYSSTFAPGEPINYVYLPYEGNTFTITKAPLQVFVSDTFKVYGADPTVFTLTYSGFKYGDTVDSLLGVPTAKTLATATSPVGDYPITMTGGESDCYTFVYQPCTLHVTRADLTVVALDTTKVYGEKNPAFAVSYMGLRNSDTEAVLPNMTVKSTADVQSGVGTYHIVPEGPFETDNYRVFYQQGALSVLPAPLTVQVKDTSRYYGVANPAFEAVYSGFRNGDSIDVLLNRPTFSTMANDTSWVGDSVVTVSGGRADNYHFDTYLPGTLMIKKAPLTFYLEDVEMEYGDKTFSYSTYYDGYCDNKDSLYYFVRRFAIETETDSTSKPGTYPVMFSGPSSSNYDVNYESEDLTIYTRILKVKAGSYTRQYGFPNPEFVLAYEGFVNNDTPDSLEIQPVAVCTATDTSGVGEYSVEIPAVFPTCYRLFRYNGTLTITPLEQSIIWEQALDSLIQGQQVFLSAATTAALPVSFSLEPNNVARLYKANGQTYLDCFGHGQVLLKAFQGGNDNVFSAPNNTKVINVLPLQTAKSYTLTIQSGEGGVTKQAVDSGSQVRIGIEPSLGWVVHTVSFNGVEVTDSLVGSVFITPPMMSDGLLSITFELINQAVEMVVSPVKVYTRPSEIVVYGLTPGETVELYGINGTVERKVLAERNEQSFSVRPGAAYLVRAGGKTVKVVL